MITIGRKFLGEKGDSAAHCSYCGARWYRSQLKRDASGNLACPDDQPGRDEVTLARGNASGAAEFAARTRNRTEENGPFFRTNADAEPVYLRTREDLE